MRGIERKIIFVLSINQKQKIMLHIESEKYLNNEQFKQLLEVARKEEVRVTVTGITCTVRPYGDHGFVYSRNNKPTIMWKSDLAMIFLGFDC